MSPIANEWVEKAEGDFIVAQREFRARKSPSYDAVCFHSQQSVEKYLKGLLQKLDIRFGKMHKLEELLDLLVPSKPLWESYRGELKKLSSYAVEFRYPGMNADKITAKAALSICKMVREAARKELGIKSENWK
jgi:HEPN domain-containing protein